MPNLNSWLHLLILLNLSHTYTIFRRFDGQRERGPVALVSRNNWIFFSTLSFRIVFFFLAEDLLFPFQLS